MDIFTLFMSLKWLNAASLIETVAIHFPTRFKLVKSKLHFVIYSAETDSFGGKGFYFKMTSTAQRKEMNPRDGLHLLENKHK